MKSVYTYILQVKMNYLRFMCNIFLPYIIYFLNFIFNWRIIALQCCIDFCHIATQISHRYMYVPFLLTLSLTPHPILLL